MFKKTNYYFYISLVALISTCLVASKHVLMVSDTIWVEEFVDSIKMFGVAEVKNWILPDATLFFPDVIFAYIISFLTNDITTRSWMLLCAEVVMFVFAAIYFFEVLLDRALSLEAISLIILLVAFSVCVAFRTHVPVYHPLNNSAHFTGYILSLPTFALCLQYLRGRSRWFLISALILISLCTFSTKAFIPFTVGPLLVYCGLNWFIYRKNKSKRTKAFFLALIITWAAGLGWYVAARYFLPQVVGYGKIPVVMEPSAILKKIVLALKSIILVINNSPFFSSFTLCLLVGSIISIMYYAKNNLSFSKLRSGNADNETMIILMFMSTISCLAFAIIVAPAIGAPLAHIPNSAFLRYFTPLYIWSFAGFIYVFESCRIPKTVLRPLLPIVSLVIIGFSLYAGQHPFHRHPVLDDYATATAAAIKHLKNQGIPLQNGLAGYWVARTPQLYLNNESRIMTFNGNIVPHVLWLRDYPNESNIYNIVVFPDIDFANIPIQEGFLPKDFIRYPGVDIGRNTKIDILYYPDGRLDAFFKRKYAELIFKIKGFEGVKIDAATLPGLIGTIEGHTRIARPGDGPGILHYGPYIPIPEGRYVAKIHYHSSGATGQWDISSLDVEKSALPAPLPFKSGEHTDSLEFIVKGNKQPKFEIRSHYNGTGELKVFSVAFEKVH